MQIQIVNGNAAATAVVAYFCINYTPLVTHTTTIPSRL